MHANDHKLVPIEIQAEVEVKEDVKGAKDNKTNGEIDILIHVKSFNFQSASDW